jgi:hypothetical protein
LTGALRVVRKVLQKADQQAGLWGNWRVDPRAAHWDAQRAGLMGNCLVGMLVATMDVWKGVLMVVRRASLTAVVMVVDWDERWAVNWVMQRAA